jgi:hypothetical protein
MAELQAPRWTERLHDLLLVALIVLRPLVWGGDATSWDSLAYLVLTAIALVLVGVEGWCGWRTAWRWNWGGVLAGLLLLALAPAAARSATPSTAWGMWGMILADLALAAYLMQTLPGRARLAWAALVAGLALLGVVAGMQCAVVLPAMRAALAHGDPALVRLETGHSDLAERLQNGGVFATFTLANTFAAYLLLTVPPVVAVLWRPAIAGWLRAATALVALAGVAALGATGSKGAYLALALSGAVVAAGALRGWRRLLPPAALLLALAAALASSSLRAGLELSAQVRLGYWQGALALIGEAPWLGHGLGGFAGAAPRAMPLSAEPTRFVHNELLEAWADGGILAAALLIALLVRLIPAGAGGPHQEPAAALLAGGGSGRLRVAAGALLLLLPLFGALGMLASNLEWWPGAASDGGWMGWMFALAALAGALVVVASQLPSPPPCAWRLAVLACALHCLIDFDLHSPGVRGCLAIIACLAAAPARSLTLTLRRQLAAAVVIAALILAGTLGLTRALELGSGEALAGCLQDLRSAQAAGNGAQHELAALCALLGQPPPPSAGPAEVSVISDQALARLDEISWRWPRSSELAARALALSPHGAARLASSERLRRLMPDDAGLRELQAQDLTALGRYQEAIAAEREAVRLAPAHLARRLALARLLDQAGDHDAVAGAALHAAAGAERAGAAALKTVVNPRNLP